MVLKAGIIGLPNSGKSSFFSYITGKKGFMSREFIVTRDTLIPRPETELIVEYVLKNYRNSFVGLDLATGSGCIARARTSRAGNGRSAAAFQGETRELDRAPASSGCGSEARRASAT